MILYFFVSPIVPRAIITTYNGYRDSADLPNDWQFTVLCISIQISGTVLTASNHSEKWSLPSRRL